MGVIVEACWKGYKQAGLKKKGDRMVPNCVPISEDINIPINVGDTLLGGKFKNKTGRGCAIIGSTRSITATSCCSSCSILR